MKQWLIVLFISIAGFSCKKDNQQICKDGFIFWGGDLANDGRGWYFSESADSTSFFVFDNLRDEYKIDSLPVNVCVTKTNVRYYCFCPPETQNYYYYHIKSIRRR